MRIGIDARLNGYREGGISQYTRCLVEALAQLDRASEYRVLHAARSRIDTALAAGPNFRPVPVWTPAHHRLERLPPPGQTTGPGLDVPASLPLFRPRSGPRPAVITAPHS